MTLMFVDSFDHYATAHLLQKWTSGGGTIGAFGRNGTNGWEAINEATSLTLGLPTPPAVAIAGVYCNPLALGQTGDPALLAFWQAGVEQIGVRLNGTTGVLYVTRNGATIGTTTYVAHKGVGFHLELKVLFALGATGTVDVRVNGAAVLSLAAVVTAPSGAASADQVTLRGLRFGGARFDDFYLANGLGAVNNDFLGDVRIQAILPDAPGFYTEWDGVTGAATHWQAVNQATPDDDASYVSDTLGVAGHRDTYGLGNVTPTTGTVPGVQVTARARKDDAGVRTIATMVRSAAVDAVGANVNLGDAYGFVSQIFELDPAAAAWTIAKINALEAGQKAVA